MGTATRWAALVFFLHAALLAWAAYVHSPTLNEPGHLAAGVSIWQFGRFDVYCVNPPLAHLLAGLPVVLAGAETDWSELYEGPGARPEFRLGEDFVAANDARAMCLMTLACWGCLPFALLGAWVCWRWTGELGVRGQDSGAREVEGEALSGARLRREAGPSEGTTDKQGCLSQRYSAGLLALALWCFCPNVLAHGALITPDMGATALAAAAGYAFWRWLKQPTWWGALGAGLVLGLAQLTKFTLLVLYPAWIVMWLVYGAECRETRVESLEAGREKPRAARLWTLGSRLWSQAAMLAAQMLISVYVINLGYAFEGTLTRLGDYRFVSAALGAEEGADKAPRGGGNRFAGSWLADVPVPLPKNYLLGIDLQKRDFEDYHHPSYLRGEFRERGWWYYYLYALAIKVPLGTWVLFLLACTAGWWKRLLTTHSSPLKFAPQWRDEFAVLCPAVVILAFVSAQTGFSEHMRYVLPIFPFVYVWIGIRVGPVLVKEWWGGENPSPPAPLPQRGEGSKSYARHAIARRAVTGIAAAALAWSITSSLWVYPHSLSYFNELVGGPTGGPEHLIHSNVDWGQDLLFLKRWLEEHPEARPINLVYFGYFHPRHAGIEFSVPEALLRGREGPVPLDELPPGWYAVSVNFVRGYPWFVYKSDGGKAGLRQNALVEFQKLTPVAMAGYSIYVYQVE